MPKIRNSQVHLFFHTHQYFNKSHNNLQMLSLQFTHTLVVICLRQSIVCLILFFWSKRISCLGLKVWGLRSRRKGLGLQVYGLGTLKTAPPPAHAHTLKHTHTHTRGGDGKTHTYTRTHARAHTHAHIHINAQTHIRAHTHTSHT